MSFKFIHIGHHKCGSTWLQYGAFPKIKNLQPLAYEDHSIPEERSNYEALMYMAHTADIFFDPDRLNSLTRNLGKANYLSWEGLVGHGAVEGPPGLSIEHTARRLKQIFNPEKILFVIRNQKTWLPSFYLDDIQFGLIADFKSWLDWRKDFQHLNWVKYSPIIKCYHNVFGRENVKVVMFEDLFNKPALEGILNDFGIPSTGIENINFTRKHNPALSGLSYSLSKIINRHFGSKANMGASRMYSWWRFTMRKKVDALAARCKLPPVDLASDGFDTLVYDTYHDDNIETARLTGLPLAENGYP